jgi:hypothetical protein
MVDHEGAEAAMLRMKRILVERLCHEMKKEVVAGIEDDRRIDRGARRRAR